MVQGTWKLQEAGASVTSEGGVGGGKGSKRVKAAVHLVPVPYPGPAPVLPQSPEAAPLPSALQPEASF